MSLEICKKVHKKLRTNSLNKTSSLRRKIRKTSRRKRKRRRCGSDGCGCTNIVNTDITTTKANRLIVTTAIRRRKRKTPRITVTATTTATETATSDDSHIPTLGAMSPTLALVTAPPPTPTPLSALRSCKINVNNKRKQKLQKLCMHNYDYNKDKASSTTANKMKNNKNNSNNNNNIHNNNNNNNNTSYTSSCIASCSPADLNAPSQTNEQGIHSKRIHSIFQHATISPAHKTTAATSSHTAFVATAEGLTSDRLPIKGASPCLTHNSSKKVQLYLKQSHQQLVYLHSRLKCAPPATTQTQQQKQLTHPAMDAHRRGDPLEMFYETVKLITAGITPATHRTSQLSTTTASVAPRALGTATELISTHTAAANTSWPYSSALRTSTTLTSSLLSLSQLLRPWWRLPSSYLATAPAPASDPAVRPLAASSLRWPQNHHHSMGRCCTPTSPKMSDSASRCQGKKLFQGLFMTLLVLSICNNNVLETNAASVRTSNSEMSLTLLEQMQLLPLSSRNASPPQTINATTMLTGTAVTATGTVSGERSVAKNNTSSSVKLKEGEEKGDQEQQQPKPNSSHPPQSLSEPSYPRTQTNQLQDFKDYTQMKKTIERANNQHQLLLVATKQKRQQRVQQLPQYLTSTQETSFGQNGMTLENGNNRTFQSLSIVDGRLTVPMEMDQLQSQQQQQQQQQQHHMNEDHSTSGSSTGSSGNSGFLVNGNEMMPFPKRHSMPVFDFGMPRNITARTGHMEAVIKCRVDRLDDKSVSWIRKRDLHILTVGKTTYTSDKRFQVTESKDSREWTLHVKSPQARDSGIYECQVNTEPKMSMAFQLNIIEISPDVKAVITGPADLYFKVGSAIILTCLVHQPSVKDIGPIHWYRGEYLITPFDVNDEMNGRHDDFGTSAALTSKSNAYDHSDADMYDSTVDDEEEQLSQILTNEITKEFTQRIAMEQQLCDTIKSRLRISNAQKSDSGNYTCQPTTASSASVMVHVINDENPAAMQKSGAAAPTIYSYTAAGAILVYHVIFSCCRCNWCGLMMSPTLYLFVTTLSPSSSSSPTSSSSMLLSSLLVMMLALFLSCQYHVIYKTGLAGIDVIMKMLQRHLQNYTCSVAGYPLRLWFASRNMKV